MSKIIDNGLFLFMLVSSILGEVVVFHFKIKFNMPKIGIIFFLLYFSLRYIRYIGEFIKKHKIESLLLLLFSLWASISFITSPYRQYMHALPLFIRYLLFPLMVFSLWIYIKKEAKLAWLIMYYFLIFLGIGGIVESFYLKQFYPIFRLSLSRAALGDPFATSFLGQHNIFGNVMVFLFWAGIFLYTKKELNFPIFILGTIISLSGLVLSTSRGAFFSLLVTIFIIPFFMKKNKQRYIILFLFALFLFLFFFSITHYPKLTARIRLIYPGIDYIKKGDIKRLYEKGLLFELKLGNFGGREGIWKRGLELFKKHPIKGIGTGSFRYISKKGSVHHLHDIFLNIIVEQGIIGLIIFLSLFSYFLYNAFKKRDENFGFYLLLVIIFSQVFDYFFDHSYFYYILTSFLFGYILNDSH